ncbi:hypothetical protein [Pseudogemmobacter faecipullorum]|uniref:Uncharacterized protein n=1 Tax=Pseudogemmobacter faecipullorum TaxID=2755041 RepID=A0ABS8CHZ9_9RHOB|nr:hypothetical protein [Pseudogemmobacter faecipullorum]MCB5409000.1 hypothetical protein [Pseudogemmobacter faecipullorum]
MQRPVDLSQSSKVLATPDLIYYAPSAKAPAPQPLSQQSAIEEMYAYYGSDRA